MSRARIRDERGAILPIAGAAVVLGLVVAALVLDVANWYQHGKTLQIRADSAVLAAGQRWAFPCDDATNTLIESTARQYVGSHMKHPPASGTLVTAPYNNLITTTSPDDVHVVFNSLQYFENGGSDWTDRVDPSVELTGKPCTREYLDAKITEEEIDGFFGRFAGISFLPSLSRKARVAPFEVESLEGILPIGVKAFDVRSGAVLFVSMADPEGAPLAKKFLARDPDGDSADSDSAEDFPGFVRWTNEADPIPTDSADVSPAAITSMPPEGVAAIVVLSSRPACGLAGIIPPCLDLTLATADEICNQGDTSCFDAPASGTPPSQTVRGGLQTLYGYDPMLDSTLLTEPPALRNVYLEKTGVGGCRDGYFVYGDAPCDLRLVADIRFAQGAAPAGRPDNKVQFHAFDAFGWCPNNGCVFTRDASLGPNVWVTTISAAALDVTATDGRNPIKLRWRMGDGDINGTPCASSPGGGSNACVGGFNNGVGFLGDYLTGTPVHQVFSSNETLSGPIEVARVWNTGATATPPVAEYTGTSSANVNSGSYPDNSAQILYIDVILGSVVATAPGDPPIALRVTGSQNGTIDCDPGLTFPDEFANGCNPRYATNTFTTNPPCPDYNDLWNTPQPWTCIKTQTGVALGNVAKGLKDRVLEGGNNCVPDNDTDPTNFRRGWNWWNNGLGSPHPNAGSMFPNFEPTDPRLVTLFVTPFGSFQGSGNAIFPISGFGAFYITGWAITGGEQDPCAGADPAPEKFLMGHFIKDVLISGATPSNNKCNPASLTPCVVALVE